MQNTSNLTHTHTHCADKEGESPQYEALLDDVDRELSMKLEILSNPHSSDQKMNQQSKPWNKTNKKVSRISTTQLPSPTALTKTISKKTGSKHKNTTQ